MKPQRAVRCNDCDEDLRGIKEFLYMIKSEIWLTIAKSSENLCIACLEKRLKRELTPDDFTSESINRPNEHKKSARLLNRLSKTIYEQKRFMKGEVK